MNVRFTQIVDYWAGVPLCAVMSVVDRICSLFRTVSKETPKKVLFIELSEMGSAFLAYSALKRTIERTGDAHSVYFLIFKSNAQSVELLNLLPSQNILTLDDSTFASFVKSTAQMLFTLRKLRIDAVIDLELFSRFTSLVSYLSGARMRAGFSNYTEEGLYRGSLLTHPVWYNPFAHIAQNFIHLADIFFSERQEKPWPKEELVPLPLGSVPDFECDSGRAEHLRAQVEGLLGEELASFRLVILNPDPGQLPLRGWPLTHYSRVIQELEETYEDLCFLVCGMKSSVQYAQQLEQQVDVRRFVNFCGLTKDLYELTELLAMASIFLTTDSGPGHLVSLTNTPAVVLFGPESPHRYRPLGKNIVTGYAGLACSPCYTAANHRHSSCRSNVCMQMISPEFVLKEMHDVLGSRS